MDRRLLLEMCLVSLLSLPEDELRSLMPALAAMAGPYLVPSCNSHSARDRIRACLAHILEDQPDLNV